MPDSSITKSLEQLVQDTPPPQSERDPITDSLENLFDEAALTPVEPMANTATAIAEGESVGDIGESILDSVKSLYDSVVPGVVSTTKKIITGEIPELVAQSQQEYERVGAEVRSKYDRTKPDAWGAFTNELEARFKQIPADIGKIGYSLLSMIHPATYYRAGKRFSEQAIEQGLSQSIETEVDSLKQTAKELPRQFYQDLSGKNGTVSAFYSWLTLTSLASIGAIKGAQAIESARTAVAARASQKVLAKRIVKDFTSKTISVNAANGIASAANVELAKSASSVLNSAGYTGSVRGVAKYVHKLLPKAMAKVGRGIFKVEPAVVAPQLALPAPQAAATTMLYGDIVPGAGAAFEALRKMPWREVMAKVPGRGIARKLLESQVAKSLGSPGIQAVQSMIDAGYLSMKTVKTKAGPVEKLTTTRPGKAAYDNLNTKIVSELRASNLADGVNEAKSLPKGVAKDRAFSDIRSSVSEWIDSGTPLEQHDKLQTMLAKARTPSQFISAIARVQQSATMMPYSKGTALIDLNKMIEAGVRARASAFNAGGKEAVAAAQELRKQLVSEIQANVPLEERGKMLTWVKNLTSEKMLNKALVALRDLENRIAFKNAVEEMGVANANIVNQMPDMLPDMYSVAEAGFGEVAQQLSPRDRLQNLVRSAESSPGFIPEDDLDVARSVLRTPSAGRQTEEAFILADFGNILAEENKARLVTFDEGQAKATSEVAAQAISEIGDRPIKIRKPAKPISRFVGYHFGTSYNASIPNKLEAIFPESSVAGKSSTARRVLYDQVSDANRIALTRDFEAWDFMDKVTRANGGIPLDIGRESELLATEVVVPLEGAVSIATGKPVKSLTISRDELLEFFAQLQDTETRQLISENGYVPKTDRRFDPKGADGVIVPSETLDRIVSEMPSGDSARVMARVALENEFAPPIINDNFMKYTGRPAFQKPEGSGTHITRWVRSDPRPMRAGSYHSNLENNPVWRQRVSHKYPVRGRQFTEATSEIARNIANTELIGAIRSATNFINEPEIARVLDDAMEPGFRKWYVDKYLTGVEGLAGSRSESIVKFQRAIGRRFYSSKLIWSLPSMFIQLPAALASVMEVSVPEFLGALPVLARSISWPAVPFKYAEDHWPLMMSDPLWRERYAGSGLFETLKAALPGSSKTAPGYVAVETPTATETFRPVSLESLTKPSGHIKTPGLSTARGDMVNFMFLWKIAENRWLAANPGANPLAPAAAKEISDSVYGLMRDTGQPTGLAADRTRLQTEAFESAYAYQSSMWKNSTVAILNRLLFKSINKFRYRSYLASKISNASERFAMRSKAYGELLKPLLVLAAIAWSDNQMKRRGFSNLYDVLANLTRKTIGAKPRRVRPQDEERELATEITKAVRNVVDYFPGGKVVNVGAFAAQRFASYRAREAMNKYYGPVYNSENAPIESMIGDFASAIATSADVGIKLSDNVRIRKWEVERIIDRWLGAISTYTGAPLKNIYRAARLPLREVSPETFGGYRPRKRKGLTVPKLPRLPRAPKAPKLPF